MYLLIGIWGGPRKLYAAIKFFPLYIGWLRTDVARILFPLLPHHLVTNVYTFSLTALYETAAADVRRLRPACRYSTLPEFLLRLRHQSPDVPLPHMATRRPRGSADGRLGDLAGVLLKMGTYGFIRFSLPFFPDVLLHTKVRAWMIALSIIGIIYGALVSLMQKDMKKLVAYSSVSHLGFCTLGIFALNSAGLSGSVLQQINHGISTGALFLIVGILYERRHTREISEYGGISNAMPVYATITMIMFLSSNGTAAAQRLRRRVHHPARHLHGELALGRMGGSRRCARGRLFAVAFISESFSARSQSEE